MDFGRLLQMVLNLVLRKAVNHGVRAGMKAVSRRGDKDRAPPPAGAPDAARRVKDTARMMRRLGR